MAKLISFPFEHIVRNPLQETSSNLPTLTSDPKRKHTGC